MKRAKMKRTVTITFDVDATDTLAIDIIDGVPVDSPLGTIALVSEMLSGDTDFPNGHITITCDGETRILPSLWR